jgi:ATP-dependent DNA helicase RecG
MAEAIAVGASEKAMLSQEELESLFTDRVERKREISGSAADRIKEAICAFANDYAGHGKPGVIFIGQNDDGSCAGTTIDDRLLTTLGGWRSDGNILPLPAMSIRRVTIGECAVAAIIVEPADSPPVRYDGRVWIRVGPRRALASPQEEQRLIERRRWGSLPFDQHPVRGASIDDIDLVRFNLEYLPSLVSRDTIAQNGRSDAQKLLSLRLVRPDLTPTVAGILLLGKDTQSWLPGAVVAWRRVDGNNIVDQTLDARTIAGTLLDQVRRVDEVMEAVNASALIMKRTNAASDIRRSRCSRSFAMRSCIATTRARTRRCG